MNVAAGVERGLDLVRRRLCVESAERVVISLSRVPLLGSLVRLVSPRPRQYENGDIRMVERYGLKWKLMPKHYFQWTQYFCREDAVLSLLLELCRDRRVFVDVGANVGFYSGVATTVMARDSSVVALEPHPQTMCRLRSHVCDNDLSKRIHAVECAVGERVGEVSLNEAHNGDWGKSSVGDHPGGRSITVKMNTVDALVQEMGLSAVDVLKIDVEGHEPAVFRGAQQTLRSHRPHVVFELSVQWMGKEALAGFRSHLDAIVDELDYEVVGVRRRRTLSVGAALSSGERNIWLRPRAQSRM